MRAERSSRSALPAEQQAELYEHSLLPELYHILRGDEAMPITRLVRGARYAARIWLLPRALAANSIPRQPAVVAFVESKTPGLRLDACWIHADTTAADLPSTCGNCPLVHDHPEL